MSSKVRLLIASNGKLRVYASFATFEEAEKMRDRLTAKNLNKAYVKAKKKGRSYLNPKEYQRVFSKFAIQETA